jgi:hypothetical protein
MTTMLLIIAMAIMSSMANPTQAQTVTSDYVVTLTDTLFCQKVDVGTFKTKCELLNGETIVMSNKDVIRYAKDGRLMQVMPVHPYNNKTKKQDIMELVDYRNQVAIYKHEYYNGASDFPNYNFYFYVNNECIEIKKNPRLEDIHHYVMNWNKESTQLANTQITTN